ncbi:MAG: hypothetical protein NT169_02090 [Chloroflexi bacterium]|nr:hypothetical protein [Chloroflexota bacterium]
MFKKIALGVLLTGLVAVLVAGALMRTNAKAGAGVGESGRQGRSSEVVTAGSGGNGGRGDEQAQGATGRGGRWAQAADVTGGQGANGTGRSNADGAATGIPQAAVQPAEWITLQGAVVSATDDLVEIQTAAGEIIPLEGQPLRFAVQQGTAFSVGDQVEVAGFDEDGEFKIGWVSNLTGGVSVELRDANGRPGWSGRGRQG